MRSHTLRPLLLLVVTALPLAAQTRPMELEDLFRLQRVAEPQISPDGKQVVYVVTEVVKAENRTNADVWVADEFGAVLDRITAKVVAFNLQKVARKAGKTLAVATTHTDLVEELGPDLMITKRFQDRIDVKAK